MVAVIEPGGHLLGDLGLLVHDALCLIEQNVVAGAASLGEQALSKLSAELFVAFETAIEVEVLNLRLLLIRNVLLRLLQVLSVLQLHVGVGDYEAGLSTDLD